MLNCKCGSCFSLLYTCVNHITNGFVGWIFLLSRCEIFFQAFLCLLTFTLFGGCAYITLNCYEEETLWAVVPVSNKLQLFSKCFHFCDAYLHNFMVIHFRQMFSYIEIYFTSICQNFVVFKRTLFRKVYILRKIQKCFYLNVIYFCSISTEVKLRSPNFPCRYSIPFSNQLLSLRC
jgi:hypothetical protein